MCSSSRRAAARSAILAILVVGIGTGWALGAWRKCILYQYCGGDCTAPTGGDNGGNPGSGTNGNNGQPANNASNKALSGPAGDSAGGIGDSAGSGLGRLESNPVVGLVDPDQGSVLATVEDLLVPSRGDTPVQWTHYRTFDQRNSGPGDTAQGQNWFHSYMQYLSLASPNDPNSSDVTWRVDAHRSFTFDNTGGYSFAANDRTFAVLSHEHFGDPNDTYRLEFLDGSLMVFYDFDYATTAVRGKLRHVEDNYGNRLTVNYDANGRIDYVTDPSGHTFRYTYLTSGVNAGKLAQIRAWNDAGDDPNDPNDALLAQFDFTYMETGHATYDADCGTTGDLIEVVVRTHTTGETGTTFSLTHTVHYRYFKDADADGDDHQLKMILQAEHCQRASDDPSISDVLTATDGAIDDYATYQFKYDGSDRCSEMTVAAGGGACCGGNGDGTGTYAFSYETQSSSNRNDWAVRCTVEREVGGSVMWTRYLDVNNWGEVWQDVLVSDANDPSQPLWGHQYTRDTNTGQVTCYVSPGAISNYTASTHTLSFYSAGLVYDYTYSASAKYMASQRVQPYSADPNDAIYVGLWEYTTLTDDTGYHATRYALEASYGYPEETTSPTAATRLATAYNYVCHPDTADVDGDSNTAESTGRIMVAKVTYPAVTEAQYGSGVATSEFSYYDSVGRLRWFKDGESAVRYYSYEALTGAQTYTVQDVYTGTSEGSISPTGITSPETEDGVELWVDWTGAAPLDTSDPNAPFYNFQTTGDDYIQRETKSRVDLIGRDRWTADAAGVRTYYAYLDDETRTYPAWNAATDRPTLPVRRVLTDQEGRTEQKIIVDPNGITFSDPPTGAETLTDQTQWVAWSRTTYDSALRRSTIWAYHVVPSSGDGSVGTNYYETAYTYSDDPNDLVTIVQLKDPEGGYTRTFSNAGRQTIKVEGTTHETSGSPDEWKTLSEYFYDQATPGSGASQGGNGHLTQAKTYSAAATARSTAYTYDYRGRRLLTTPEVAPYTLTEYDNVGRAVVTGTYSSTRSAGDDPRTVTGGRLSLSETSYNDRGWVCQTQRSAVNSDGTKDAGSDLIAKIYYDRTGRVVATWAPNSGPQITKYDGAGSVIERQTCVSLGNTAYSNGAFDYSSDNPVVELTCFALDDGGRTKETNRYVLEAGATAYLDPNSPTTNGMQSCTRQYYDLAGRITQSTNFGTFPENGLSSPMNDAAKANIGDPNDPEERSDTQLVTTYTYNTAGWRVAVTDPDGIVTRYEHDALGRRTAMIEDYADPAGNHLNRRTEYEYNGNNDLTALLAKAVGEYDAGHTGLDDQVTSYVYDSPVSTRWVTEIHYPGSDGQPSDDPNDTVTFTYNYDGTVATRTDQNGSVITYQYDTQGRKTHELLTTVGSGVDDTVYQVATTYDDAGRVEKLTHKDSASVPYGAVVNQVQFTYDGLGTLTHDRQEHDGAVDPNATPLVEYAYTLSGSGSGNYQRLNYLLYPNGRHVHARYTLADPNSMQNEIAVAFGRITQLANSDDPNNVYVEYRFAGRHTLVGRQSPLGGSSSGPTRGNDTFLNYDTGTDDEYAGKDLFGRIVSQKVTDAAASSTRDDIQYRSTRDGSPQFAQPQSALPLGRSQLYSYDGLHRLTEADIGLLNGDPNNPDLLAEWDDPAQIVYTMDVLGNITTLNRKNSNTSADETRTYNATNELTSRTVNGEAARYWVWDTFTDNDTAGWEVADLDPNSTDGSWAAASGALTCTGVITVSGAPGGSGSILLIDNACYQDVRLTCAATRNTGSYAGLVFGYRDAENFWVKIYSSTKASIYEISGGSWALRQESARLWDYGGSNPLAAEVRAGAADTYAGTAPAGQVGLWCGSASGFSFDDFQVRDIAGPFEVDGRWFCDKANVRVDNSDSNALEVYGTDGLENCLVRRGFRGDKYVATFKFKWNNTTSPGWLVRWLSPGDYLALAITRSDKKARLYQREEDGTLSTLATASTALTLTSGSWYDALVVIDDDPNDAGLQQLRFWVDSNQNGFGDDTCLITSTAVDDVWSAGYAGLYQAFTSTGAIQFYDDVRIGYDENDDGDILDAGDKLQVVDNFDSNVMSLSYDNNGSLTNDGVYQYVYDAWNRLVQAQRKAAHSGQADDVTTIATYAYLPDNRRASKVVENCGLPHVANDGGNQTVHFYYGGMPGASGGVTRWNVFETRDGSDTPLRQWVCGTQYVDEVLIMDVNDTQGAGSDCDPDSVAQDESGQDRRYFYHQDRNWNVIALTEYADGVGVNGRIAERSAYTPYGEFFVLKGDAGDGEVGRALLASAIGNMFFHQGLLFDREKGSYQNRRREYLGELGRPVQRDRLVMLNDDARGVRPSTAQNTATCRRQVRESAAAAGYRDGLSLHVGLRGNPERWVDPSGEVCGSTWNDWLVPDKGPCGIFDFTSCCQGHDDCYGDCDGPPKSQCDTNFLNCMHQWCSANHPSGSVKQNLCYVAGTMYFNAVDLSGWCCYHSGCP